MAALLLACLLAAGCGSQAQSGASGRATPNDRLACALYGPWLQELHAGQTPTSHQTAQLSAVLQAADNKDLRREGSLLESSFSQSDDSLLASTIRAIGQTCSDLGLIDSHGNPT